jgi:CDGSH-type Zn-finger protein
MAEITPTENGPYWVRGDFKITLSDGSKKVTEDEVWLCRCGQSNTKPFCDGSHNAAGFVSDDLDMRDSG